MFDSMEETLNLVGFEGLSARIIETACEDIEESYNAILQGRAKAKAFKMFDECLEFLNSEWAELLSPLGFEVTLRYLNRFDIDEVNKRRSHFNV